MIRKALIGGLLLALAQGAGASVITVSKFVYNAGSARAANDATVIFTPGPGNHWHVGSYLHHGHRNGPLATLRLTSGNPFSLLSLRNLGGLTQVTSSSGAVLGNASSSLARTVLHFGAGFRNVTSIGLRGHFSIDDVRVTAAAVPEPAVLSLLLASLAGLGAVRRRRDG